MKKTWWQKSVGYQIYPRSFYDSNHDGVGDLRGIIEKFDHVVNLGVNLLWICPFYKSPMDDNGYDVSDFYQVDPLFGSLDDFKELLKLAHAHDIRIILDLVLNQTSDEHPWFIESKKSKDNEKRDYYIWQDPKMDEQNQPHPPTNWASFFGGSAWNFDATTNQYYMKIFSDKMPDLNWENKHLRMAMMDVALWWLNLGVDGFRVDAIAHLAKDTTFSDSTMPLNQDGFAPDWKKFSNRDRLFDYLKEFHHQVLAHYDVVTVGEVGGGASVKDAIRYAGYHNHGFNMVFNFDHCWHNGAFDDQGKTVGHLPVDVVGLKKTFNRWIKGSKDKAWIPHYWLNHDHPRVASQYGDPQHYHKESASMLGMILLGLPGTPFIYNGEEIGMTNVDYESVDDFNDVWVKNFVQHASKHMPLNQILNHLKRTSRDNARTPMQWNDQPYAGFSTHAPHQKNVSNFDKINVERQQNEDDSILSYYKKAIKLRLKSKLSHVLIYGDFAFKQINHSYLFAYERSYKQKKLMVICNFSNQVIDNPWFSKTGKVILNNYPKHTKQLLPYQAIYWVKK